MNGIDKESLDSMMRNGERSMDSSVRNASPENSVASYHEVKNSVGSVLCCPEETAGSAVHITPEW